MKRKKAIIISIAVILLSICTIGISYAYLTKTIWGSKNVSIISGTLRIHFTDGDLINFSNMAPMSDQKGQELTPYTFTIQNTGNILAYYTVSLEEDAANSLDHQYIKMRITGSNGYDSGIVTRSSYTDTKIIAEKTLETSASVTYQVWMWLSDTADNSAQGTTYKAKIVVNGTSNPVEKSVCDLNGDGFETSADRYLLQERISSNNLEGLLPGCDRNRDRKITTDDSELFNSELIAKKTTCDLNQDGYETTVDAQTLMNKVTAGETSSLIPSCDMNADGTITMADVLIFNDWIAASVPAASE